MKKTKKGTARRKKTIQKIIEFMPPSHVKSLGNIRIAVEFNDSIAGWFVTSFHYDGILASTPEKFRIQMRLEAVEIRDAKSRSKKPLKVTPLTVTPDIMNGGISMYRVPPLTEKQMEERDAALRDADDYDD